MSKEELLKVITEERAIVLIKTICPHFEHTAFKITHIGEYDQYGWKHNDSKCTIDSNVGRVVIWEDNIHYYKFDAKPISGAFTAFRLLDNWGFFKL